MGEYQVVKILVLVFVRVFFICELCCTHTMGSQSKPMDATMTAARNAVIARIFDARRSTMSSLFEDNPKVFDVCRIMTTLESESKVVLIKTVEKGDPDADELSPVGSQVKLIIEKHQDGNGYKALTIANGLELPTSVSTDDIDEDGVSRPRGGDLYELIAFSLQTGMRFVACGDKE